MSSSLENSKETRTFLLGRNIPELVRTSLMTHHSLTRLAVHHHRLSKLPLEEEAMPAAMRIKRTARRKRLNRGAIWCGDEEVYARGWGGLRKLLFK
jgi:hypothetical protein